MYRLKIQTILEFIFLTSAPLQTMAIYPRVSIAGWKCLCVSGSILPWSICFYTRTLVLVLYLKLCNYIMYIYVYMNENESTHMRSLRLPRSEIHPREDPEK